ncbi:hypothetical protein ACFV3E_20565 [Streptomyces sp. NPDC059718]
MPAGRVADRLGPARVAAVRFALTAVGICLLGVHMQRSPSSWPAAPRRRTAPPLSADRRAGRFATAMIGLTGLRGPRPSSRKTTAQPPSATG